MKLLKSILKIIISVLILYFVFRKIDGEAFMEIIKGINPIWMVVAFISLLLSQYISSVRLHRFWTDMKLPITRKFNWHLYLLGMYYNLLLPGSIGGDGYKVYVLNKKYEVKKRRLVRALILDRLSGLVGLGVWLCSLVFIYMTSSHIFAEYASYAPIVLVLILVAVATGWAIMKKFFPEHFDSYWFFFILSMLVQGLSLGSCMAIMAALGIFEHTLAYLSLFLMSSVAAVIPITFGGAGARELTFMTGAQFLPVEVNVAVALSILFYLINVLASFIGMYFSFTTKDLTKDILEKSPAEINL